MIVPVPPTSGGNVGPPSVVVVVDVVVLVVVVLVVEVDVLVVEVDVLVVEVVVLVVEVDVLVVEVDVLVVEVDVLVVEVDVLVVEVDVLVVEVDVLVVEVDVLVVVVDVLVVVVDVLVVEVVVLVVVVDVVLLVVDVVVVGHGSGEHEPAPRSRPPSVAHCVALSMTQVNAPMGEPGRQHCPGGAVVVVDVEVDVLVLDVEVVFVDVVVVGSTQVPSEGGLFTLNSRVSLLVRVPVWNATLYESPPPISRRMQPPVPRSGGTTDTGENRALPLTLMMKTPLPLFLICADLTGPCSPRASLYLKPFAVLPDQKGLPLLAVPCGSAKVCCVGWSPSARSVSVAPPTVGSPTKGFGLDRSFALPVKLRLSGVLGFLRLSWLPRIG